MAHQDSVSRTAPSKWRQAVRLLSILATILSVVWLFAGGGFEPAIGALLGIAGVISSFVNTQHGAPETTANGNPPARDTAVVTRSEIERALSDLVAFEEGPKFQSLSVILARKRWPELIACERKWDLGLDAYAPSSASLNSRAKALACSLTATLGKLKKDAKRICENYDDVSTLIFYTPQKITNHTARKWAREIKEAFGFSLTVVPCEDIIASLMDPANAALCRTHLGISVRLSETIQGKLGAARQACCEEANAWLNLPRLRGIPLIQLRLSRISTRDKDVRETVDLNSIQEELSLASRLVLEAPPGAGKTTTLAQLAKAKTDAEGLCLIVDLPCWIDSNRDILEFVARLPGFSSRAVGSADLAHLSRTHHIDFLLNGWNEISGARSESACQKLRELDRCYPSAGIIVATRAHLVTPPLPGASRIRIHQLSREQRIDYLEKMIAGRATELSAEIDGDRTLDELTRTPLILHEVARLHESGRAIPRTKLDILRAVAERIEDSEEHCAQLKNEPLFGKAEPLLSALAFDMTQNGRVDILDGDARRSVSKEAESLRDMGQLAVSPEPISVLAALTGHHVLVRHERPAAFRFQHQQYQEFYAALRVVRLLAGLASGQDPDLVRDFKMQYLDQPIWGESLKMISEAIGAKSPVFGPEADTVEVGECLVKCAIPVDPVFAAALSRECGQEVWLRVGHDLGECLRRWYKIGSKHLRRRALAGMFATGSSDFGDIIVPLLSGDDRQVRMGTYSALREFHFSSLGPDWRVVVNGWGETQRIDFLHEVISRAGLADIAEDFTRTDPSEKVRVEAAGILGWLGADDALERVCDSMSEETLVEMLRQGSRAEDLPASVRPKVRAALRSILEVSKGAADRLRTLVRAAKVEDPSAVEHLKRDLEAIPEADLQSLGESLLASALGAIQGEDEQWAGRWVAERIADGSLWADRWIGRATVVEPELLGQILERICTEEVEHRQVASTMMLLAKAADEHVVETICRRLYDLGDQLAEPSDGRDDPSQWRIFEQLKDVARALPPALLVSGILKTLSEPPTLGELWAVLEVLGRTGDELLDFRAALTEPGRQMLRDLLARVVPFVLEQDDFWGSMKVGLALALARVGDPENAEDLHTLIRADLERVRRGRQAKRRGEQGAMANGVSVSWANWYVQALSWLGADAAEPILLGLLDEPGYEECAASALARLAGRAPRPPPAGLGMAPALPGRESTPDSVVDEERRVRYAQAITTRLQHILAQRSESGTPDSFNWRARSLAGVLAYLDGSRSMDLVMRVMALPEEWGGWRQVDALDHLVRCSARLPTDSALDVLNPIAERILERGGHDEQNAYLLERCLCVLPFTDDPARGIDRIRDIASSASLPAYRLCNLVAALGRCGSEECLGLLIELAGSRGLSPSGFGREWVDAVAGVDSPTARRLLLSFVDPEEAEWSLEISDDLNGILSGHIVVPAKKESKVRERILGLCRKELSPTQRQILTDVLAQLGSTEAALAGLDLIDDRAEPRVPHEFVRMLDGLLVERQPYGSSGYTYTLKPRSGAEIRRRLFELVLDDDRRRHSALELLGMIDDWRLDHGKPVSEPRHPAIDTGRPWPLLEYTSADGPS